MYHDNRGSAEMTTRDNALPGTKAHTMAANTTNMALGARRDPGTAESHRRVDERGVVVGPWTSAARRSNALLQAARMSF